MHRLDINMGLKSVIGIRKRRQFERTRSLRRRRCGLGRFAVCICGNRMPQTRTGQGHTHYCGRSGQKIPAIDASLEHY
jgi:hypothetical protein